MTKIAGAIIVVLGIMALLLFSAGRIDITREEGWVDWDPAPPQSTLNAGDAAANATMVARQQSAQMTASAAQSGAQATAQAAVAHATRQAMVADQALLDEAAARRAEGTARAIRATTEHEKFVATAVSAAEATRMQSTAVAATAISAAEATKVQSTRAAATATRQVEEDRMTATVEGRHATATRQAIKREEKKADQRHVWQTMWHLVLAAAFVSLAVALVAIALLLLRQCLKHMGKWPSTLRGLLFIWNKYARR